MTFPASPNNGVTATVNGISYTYNAARNTWTRTPTTISDLQPNLGTATTNITTLLSNAATQATTLNTINANVGAFQSYANTKIGTNTNSNLVVVTNTASTGTTTGALVVRGGMGVAGNVYANTIYTTTGIVWAGNGAAFSSGAEFTAGTTPPASPIAGQQWYDTTDDILYEFIENYWVDIQSPTTQSSDYTISIISVGNIATSNIYADRFFYSNGTAFSSSNYGNTEVAAYLVANPQGSTYSNTNVEAYLGANLGSATTNITTLFSNAATQATTINTVNANIGAFQTYANTAFNYGNTQVAGYLTSNVSGLVTVTSSLQLPKGNTAQRPAVPDSGALRYNTTLNRVEAYMPSAGWLNVVSDSYSIDYMIVAGGGGGGAGHGGGGGAGGMITATSFTVTPNSGYAITIGSGGLGGLYNSAAPTDGSNSSAFSSIAVRGGSGGGQNQPGVTQNGQAGGSGGGGGNTTSGVGTGGAATAGQGNAGGTGSGGGPWAGAGGGGAGAAGSNNPNTSTGGNGGAGAAWLDGTTYAGGGGGGGGDSGTAGTGGAGGGGAGRPGGGTVGFAGTTNTGGGGGGSRDGSGGNGGSGIVIVRYLGTQRGTGGTVTSSGGYTYHTFTGSGTFTG